MQTGWQKGWQRGWQAGHKNYQGAPSDGSAWLSDGDQARRALRGGARDDSPGNLRWAVRSHIDCGMLPNEFVR
ncbi:MAG: hypothetical protein EBY28_02230 [Betaproteobacteria bacterium]|nr:hypothetical protein [Betaproteobacteria bacterium]